MYFHINQILLDRPIAKTKYIKTNIKVVVIMSEISKLNINFERLKLNSNIIYLGNSKNNVFENMAIDEALMEIAEKENKFFFRTYDFNKDSIILASSDSPNNIKVIDKNIEVTRRISGGKPIYIDKNVFSYSFIGPLNKNSELQNGDDIHKFFGSMILNAIKEISTSENNIELGKAYAIKVNNKPIAGHGQHIGRTHAFLYHGVMAIGPWDADKINRYLKLIRSDYEYLKDLPSINKIAKIQKMDNEYYKNEITRRIVKTLNHHFKSVETISDIDKKNLEILKNIKVEKYKSESWKNRTDIALKEDSRFCLVFAD